MKYVRIILFVLAMTPTFTAHAAKPWYRIDADQQGHIFWVGASNGQWTHDLIFYPGPGWFEFDFGRVIPIGEGNDLQPMIGLIHDPINGKLNWVVPQIFWFSFGGRHSSELWALWYLKANGSVTDYHWLLFQERWELSHGIQTGPQVEWFYDYTLKQDTQRNFGWGVKIPYGEKSSIDLSVSKDFENKRTVGRATFLAYFE